MIKPSYVIAKRFVQKGELKMQLSDRVQKMQGSPIRKFNPIAIAAEEKISLNDLFIQVMRNIVDHPQEMKDWKERYDQLPEEERRRLEQIRISCVYPVEDGETEEAGAFATMEQP